MASTSSSKRRLRVLGVMTGTSCDGLDAACIEIVSGEWQALWSASAPYPKALREKVLGIQVPDTRLPIRDWLALHSELGGWYGQVLNRLIRSKSSGRTPLPDVIANHGQTVAHFPGLGPQSATLQLGDPTRIASLTGLTVISNFREGDMAAGGQGAPLVPLFHASLARKLMKGRNAKLRGVAIHNIGGISNFTYLGSGKTIAFDTGPGNLWIDAATESATRGRNKIDLGGKLAARGKVDLVAVESILARPYFSSPPPKSTGRDDFPIRDLLACTSVRDESLVSIATAITVESMARAYEDAIIKKRLPLSRIYVCGGGAKNATLLRWWRSRLPHVEILPMIDAGLDPQTIEAQAFAYFGYLSLMGHPLGGSWTGAKGFAPAGHIVPGKNWAQVIRKL